VRIYHNSFSARMLSYPHPLKNRRCLIQKSKRCNTSSPNPPPTHPYYPFLKISQNNQAASSARPMALHVELSFNLKTRRDFSVCPEDGDPNLTPPKYEPIRARMFATILLTLLPHANAGTSDLLHVGCERSTLVAMDIHPMCCRF
jgi:hypothetical protein